MIEKVFWEDVRSAWVSKALPPAKEMASSSDFSGKDIMDSDSSDGEWGMDDGIPFDMVDYDQAITAGLFGENFDIKSDEDSYSTRPEKLVQLQKKTQSELQPEVKSEFESEIKPEIKSEPKHETESRQEAKPEPKPVKRKRPKLNTDKFEWLIEQQKIPAYTEACHLLLDCELPENMDELMNQLIERMSVLQETSEKFNGIYEADLSQFYGYYIPEALELTSTYLEYLDIDIGEKLINETEKEVMDAIEKLILSVNEKIEEICRYAMIEIRAKAKALDSMMSQDGYVGSEFKIR